MYENIFKREEEKFILNKEQYVKLFNTINNHIIKDKYFETTVCNIYFDNEHNDLIVDSIEKPLYKHKVKLRSYGVPNLDSDVFFEIKFKYKSMVGKRRIKLTLKEFNDYLDNHNYNNSQIMKEIDYLFKLYNLEPSYFIGYDRKSYCGKNNEALRITIDSNLRSRTNNLSLELGDIGTQYFNKELFIMEIKTLGGIPMWLTKTLSDLKIYPISFSKYGSIYKKDKEKELC